MPTTTTSTRAGASKPVKDNITDLNVVCCQHTLTVPGAADVLQAVPVPKGARIVDVTLTSTDSDTHVSPTLEMKVGDTDSTDDDDRYITASAIGTTGGVARMNNQAGHLYTFTADGTIDITFSAVAATFAAGTITLSVTYCTDAAA